MPITLPSDPKKWYESKMLWANASAIVTGLGAYFVTGDAVALGAAVASTLQGVVNILLRLVTKQPIG